MSAPTGEAFAGKSLSLTVIAMTNPYKAGVVKIKAFAA
jgi:hypothetical protein